MTTLTLRPANLRDREFLFRLKNDPEALKWSWNHEPVTFRAHSAWLVQALKLGNPRIFIAVVGKRRVGSIRVAQPQNEVSITVAAQYRGKGYGTSMLRALPDDPITGYIAHIDLENTRSLRAFQNAGFTVRYLATRSL